MKEIRWGEMTIRRDSLVDEVKEFLQTHTNRSEIEEWLEDTGFRLWANTYRHGSAGPLNLDEQFWVYDVGTPNGQLIVFVNWIDGIAWIYTKTERVDIGG